MRRRGRRSPGGRRVTLKRKSGKEKRRKEGRSKQEGEGLRKGRERRIEKKG